MGTIAAMEGSEYDYIRRQCLALAKQKGIIYKPKAADKLPFGMQDTGSHKDFRRNLSDKLYDYLEVRHPLQVAIDTGVTQTNQLKAKQRPYSYDWQLSQIERFASALNIDFKDLMLSCLLTEKEAEWLKNAPSNTGPSSAGFVATPAIPSSSSEA